MKVMVHIGLKPGVLNAEAATVHQALQGHGFSQLQSVSMGKWVALEFNGLSQEAAEEEAHKICKDMLVNQVIETYQLSTEAVWGT